MASDGVEGADGKKKKKKKKDKKQSDGEGTPRRRRPGSSRRSGKPKARAKEVYQEKGWLPPIRSELKALVQGRAFTDKDFRWGECVGKGSMATVRICTLKSEHVMLIPLAIKTMEKSKVVASNQSERVKSERLIWEILDSPFVISFLAAFHDPRRVCFIIEFSHGGDLYGRLKQEGRLPVDHAKYYAAELNFKLRYLHSKGVAYRDLKPENIMIHKDGHTKVTDFGFAKMLRSNEVTYSVVGTPEYIAPEIISSKGHAFAVDFWSLGVVIYEMLCGYPPFLDTSPYKIYEKIMALDLVYPRHFDIKARDLLKNGLLVHDTAARFDAIGVCMHKWFEFVDWEEMGEHKIIPPYLPSVSTPMDTRRFEIVPDSVALDRYNDCHPIMKNENIPFVGMFPPAS